MNEQLAALKQIWTDEQAEFHGRFILGVEPTGRTVEFETVDVIKVVNGKITDHWGVGNLLKIDDATGRRHAQHRGDRRPS